MSKITSYIFSSIGKKQIVAITGIGLVLFLLVHLSGNLLVFNGPKALNDYSDLLHSLGGLLWVARIGLIAMFTIHIAFTAMLVVENRKARQQNYAKFSMKERSLATKTMPITGTLILAYLIVHLNDYTFTKANPQNAVVNGDFLGLYGLVYNSFLDPLRAGFYIITMIAIGFHMTHAIQSLMQTFGASNKESKPLYKKVALGLGLILAIGFSSIPVYVNVIDAMGLPVPNAEKYVGACSDYGSSCEKEWKEDCCNKSEKHVDCKTGDCLDDSDEKYCDEDDCEKMCCNDDVMKKKETGKDACCS